eukprot:gnl/Trimastix_PCT/2742.p1 GENE.gnl/Trimastix_PCT/2742~~gnl/Trimastix_PCT/2742.p1  ORF type:complete len:886 (+),score=265.33 gnl/Trimastix_PCT/2742:321-2660(+)
MHTGPMKHSGSVEFENGKMVDRPSCDGQFDRIGHHIEDAFGSDEDSAALARVIQQRREDPNTRSFTLAGDAIPCHTGLGPDFWLALYREYPYCDMFHMVHLVGDRARLLERVLPAAELKKAEYTLDAAQDPPLRIHNLTQAQVLALREHRILPGDGERILFHEMGKDSNWNLVGPLHPLPGASCSAADRGPFYAIYYSFFKIGQPALKWCSRTEAASVLLKNDLAHTIVQRGCRLIRYDANGFVGLEPHPDAPKPGERSDALCLLKSEGHPLMYDVNNRLAMYNRSLGAFSFQELNLTLKDIKDTLEYGPDLALDFGTRPAFIHALLTRNTAFLTFMMRRMHLLGLDPVRMIRHLQNHDEITYEILDIRPIGPSACAFRESIRGTMRAFQQHHNYILRSASNGIAATLSTLIFCILSETEWKDELATRQSRIQALIDLASANQADPRLRDIRRGHLALLAFLTLQPGCVALSGWDLRGCLSLHWPRGEWDQEGNKPAFEVNDEAVAAARARRGYPERVSAETERSELGCFRAGAYPAVPDKEVQSGDYRWINRGSYALLRPSHEAFEAQKPSLMAPIAPRLYETLDEQLQDDSSFVANVRAQMRMRQAIGLHTARQLPPMRLAAVAKGVAHARPVACALDDKSPEGEKAYWEREAASAMRESLEGSEGEGEGVLVLPHVLPSNRLQLTMIHFGRRPLRVRVDPMDLLRHARLACETARPDDALHALMAPLTAQLETASHCALVDHIAVNAGDSFDATEDGFEVPMCPLQYRCLVLTEKQ